MKSKFKQQVYYWLIITYHVCNRLRGLNYWLLNFEFFSFEGCWQYCHWNRRANPNRVELWGSGSLRCFIKSSKGENYQGKLCIFFIKVLIKINQKKFWYRFSGSRLVFVQYYRWKSTTGSICYWSWTSSFNYPTPFKSKLYILFLRFFIQLFLKVAMIMKLLFF